MPPHTDIKALCHTDFHNQGLDIDHLSGDIEFFDHVFKHSEVIFACHDHEAVCRLVGHDLGFLGNDRGLSFCRPLSLLLGKGCQHGGEFFSIGILKIIDMDISFTRGCCLVQQFNQASYLASLVFRAKDYQDICPFIRHNLHGRDTLSRFFLCPCAGKNSGQGFGKI